MIVLDASVVLATLLNEPGGEVFANLTEEYRISTMNLGEIASRLSDYGYPDASVYKVVDSFRLQTVPLSAAQAVQAGLWRKETRRFGLSMGDRICLALGLELGATVYTADRAWEGLDLGVRVQVVR